ncbi:MAG: putative oxidoreductase [Candidatus Paceibacteria bacterium]|jgi:putative oxidoreductase
MNKPLLHTDLALFLLRLAVGGLMLLHGIDKIQNGVGSIGGMLGSAGLPEKLAWGVYLGEVLAPLLMLLGFLTRPAALILAITMGVSIWLGYGADALSLGEHGGLAVELNLLYLAGGLTIFFAGGGSIGVGRGESKWS